MKWPKRNGSKDSVWTRDLIPEDSVLRRDLLPEDSIWGKELIPDDSFMRRDLLAFAKRKSPCLKCPILMLADERHCNRYDRIPDDIWDGIEQCSLYNENTG